MTPVQKKMPSFDENKALLRDLQLEMDQILFEQASAELTGGGELASQEEDGDTDAHIMAQKELTLNSLRDVNELWMTRLD